MFIRVQLDSNISGLYNSVRSLMASIIIITLRVMIQEFDERTPI
jgi:hypothetical protein